MWKFLLLAAFIIVALLVFIRLTSIRYRKKPIIGLYPRILISLLFPVIGLCIVLLGSFLLILVVFIVMLFLLLLLLTFIFLKPKIYVFKKKF